MHLSASPTSFDEVSSLLAFLAELHPYPHALFFRRGPTYSTNFFRCFPCFCWTSWFAGLMLVLLLVCCFAGLLVSRWFAVVVAADLLLVVCCCC